MSEKHASLVMRRRLAWNETDAAGHNHFASAFRWMEEAEHTLYRCLGFGDQFIATVPRVHIDIDYTARIMFMEELVVRIAVVKVGGSSMTLQYTADKLDGTRAATANLVIVHVSSTSEGSAPWPDDVRAALLSPVEYEIGTSESIASS